MNTKNDIRSIMHEMNWTTTDLSNATGYALRTVQDYVKNNHAPESAFTIIQLAAAMAKGDLEAIRQLQDQRRNYQRSQIKRIRQKAS